MIEQKDKILFVDDEPNILKSLQRLMLDEDWETHFASNAEQALEILSTVEIDLIVSDAMMPKTDGVKLLTIVKQKFPTVIRIFLTSFSKQQDVVTALADGYVQQIIPKPWIDQEFKEIIRSALRQGKQQKNYCPDFQALMNSIPLLPALPENYSQVQACISGEDVDIEKMTAIISQDVALSCALLHWANSALFGQRFRVDSIKKAIIVLGTDIVVNLVLSEAVSNSVAKSSKLINKFNLNKFKCHSIATATIARQLIKTLHSSDSELQDRAFIAGLLHDMGKLIAASHFGKQFSAAIAYAEQNNCLLFEAETKILGTNHAEVGGFLAEWWALPHFIVHSIKLHHELNNSPIEPEVINAVYLANQISYRFGFGFDCNGEKSEVKINSELWNRFFLSEEGLEILHVETEAIIKNLCS